MYELLRKLARRPDPFSSMTIRDLWTRPHIASQMLAYHLDPDTAFASRPVAAVEDIVGWLDEKLSLDGKRMCDLGCGPGLYTSRFARRGAKVTGVDFSSKAIAHAESQVSNGEQNIEYLVADYVNDDLPTGFDVVTLIYYDYCALSPVSRNRLLLKIRSMLNTGGRLIMDVLTDEALKGVHEQVAIEERLMNGFWSASDYVGVHRTWVYPRQDISLDHYTIVEPDNHWEIFNWMQYFSSARLTRELEEAGFVISTLTMPLTGEALTTATTEITVIADKDPKS
jgi:SAM-dependent methyltransferase